MRSITRVTVASLFVLAVGCGDDEPTREPLPKAPQAFPSDAFVAFPVVEAGATGTFSMVIVNGGQDDLVLNTVTLTDDAGGAFTIGAIVPANKTADSQQGISIQIDFSPPARGMYLGSLEITANAENIKTLVFDVIGPASASPRLEIPDILIAEDPAEVIPALHAASVRYINVGQGSLIVTGYEILNDAAGAFDFAPGVAQPSRRAIPAGGCTQEEVVVDTECVNPIEVGPGQFVPVGVLYTSPGAGTHTADFVIHSNDPDQPSLTVGLLGEN